MSGRDKELKESFLNLFSTKLHEIAPTYFDRKRDPLVETMKFSDEEIKELETELKNTLFQEVNTDENTET